MSRMLEALKVLDTRQRVQNAAPAPPAAAAAETVPWEESLSSLEALADVSSLVSAELAAEMAPPAVRAPQLDAMREVCTLPTVSEVGEHYLEMAGQISDQLAANYSNVMLFVGADRWVEPSFSMTHLAQAFAMHTADDVLLVDGDLQSGLLSKSVARPGPGLVEAMLGQAQWPDIIHPTSAVRIDFVARGNASVPTIERTEFGWGALRPLYRTVLIGLAGQAEPQTAWLGGRCDAVYLVISRPHTRRRTASAAVNSLRACGANVVGTIVVND
jgi:Mrp family chromosome partitioning ATPase